MSPRAAEAAFARAGRAATGLIIAHVLFFLGFVAGGVISIWTFARNGENSVTCLNLDGACGPHHSYVLGLALLAAGFLGSLVTIAVGMRMAVGYGLEALTSSRRRPRPDGQAAAPLTPPLWPDGQPPGTPPRGTPL